MTIRILVADDQPLVSAGISALLDADPDIDVVAQTVMAAVVDAAAAHLPDVVVMNVPAEGADVTTKIIACSGGGCSWWPRMPRPGSSATCCSPAPPAIC